MARPLHVHDIVVQLANNGVWWMSHERNEILTGVCVIPPEGYSGFAFGSECGFSKEGHDNRWSRTVPIGRSSTVPTDLDRDACIAAATLLS